MVHGGETGPEPPPIVEVTPGTPKPVVPAAETNALVPITETMSEPTPTPVSTVPATPGPVNININFPKPTLGGLLVWLVKLGAATLAAAFLLD